MKIDYKNKTWKLGEYDRPTLWRWSTNAKWFLASAVVLTAITLTLAYTVDPTWATGLIGLVVVYGGLTWLDIADEWLYLRDRVYINGLYADAFRKFSTITEGPHVAMARKSIEALVIEAVTDEARADDYGDRAREWYEAAKRLTERDKKDRIVHKGPSHVAFLKDYLDSFDMLDTDFVLDEAPEFELLERSMIPPRPRKKVKA